MDESAWRRFGWERTQRWVAFSQARPILRRLRLRYRDDVRGSKQTGVLLLNFSPERIGFLPDTAPLRFQLSAFFDRILFDDKDCARMWQESVRAIDKYLAQYVRGSYGIDYKERIKVMKLLWDAIGPEFGTLSRMDLVTAARDNFAFAQTHRFIQREERTFLELVDGCELDVRGTVYETFPDLVHYCRCVAGSIGRLSVGVFEASDPIVADPLADSLGVGLQLTNILRDVREDLQNGRVYLPQEELEAGHVELRLDADGFVADEGGRTSTLIREQAARAEKWYAEGLQLLPLLDSRSAACCSAMAGIYHRLLKRIARDPQAVLRERISLPAWEKAYLAARSITKSRR